jgi:hypothetical protein
MLTVNSKINQIARLNVMTIAILAITWGVSFALSGPVLPQKPLEDKPSCAMHGANGDGPKIANQSLQASDSKQASSFLDHYIYMLATSLAVLALGVPFLLSSLSFLGRAHSLKCPVVERLPLPVGNKVTERVLPASEPVSWSSSGSI